ncbi:hypothetical protein BH10CYA1_BH10CYA1_53560 [soil metagenome]
MNNIEAEQPFARVHSSLAEARQFSATRQSAASLFVRLQATEGLKNASQNCLDALLEIQSLELSSPETLVQASLLAGYNNLELYIKEVRTELDDLRKPVLARLKFMRRRVYPILGVVSLLSLVLFVGFHSSPTASISNGQTETAVTHGGRNSASIPTDTYVSATAGETEVAIAGAQFDAYKSSTITAEKGSRGKANGGSIVIAKDGAQVEALAGSTVYAHIGAQVYARRGSSVTAQPGAKVQADEGVQLRWNDELPGFAN